MKDPQKVKERFLQKFFEPTFLDSQTYSTTSKDEEMIEWWLKEIDQVLREKREEVEVLWGSVNMDDKEFYIKRFDVLAILTPPSEEKK